MTAQRRLFPQGENICTRLPIRVQLRNAPEPEDPELWIMQKQPGGGAAHSYSNYADGIGGGGGVYVTRARAATHTHG